MGLKSQEAAIEFSNNQENLKHLTEVARHCNYRRERSVLIQSRCDEIFMAAYLKAQIYPVEVDGMVVGLGQGSLSVMDLEYGLMERMFLQDHFRGYTSSFDSGTLTLTRSPGADNPYYTFSSISVRMALKVRLRLTTLLSPFGVKIVILGTY
jgi:exoribonuclease R